MKQAWESGDLCFPGEVAALAQPRAFRRLLSTLYEKTWNVHCKRPFGSAERVVKYFGRYTHRVAVSNERIVAFDGKTAVLRIGGGGGRDRRRALKLTATEFIRRYLFHVLPDRFVKIRYYGLLGNSHRAERLQTCRRLLGCLRLGKRNDRPKKKPWHQLLFELTGIDPTACPVCGGGRRCLLAFGPQVLSGLPP